MKKLLFLLSLITCGAAVASEEMAKEMSGLHLANINAEAAGLVTLKAAVICKQKTRGQNGEAFVSCVGREFIRLMKSEVFPGIESACNDLDKQPTTPSKTSFNLDEFRGKYDV